MKTLKREEAPLGEADGQYAQHSRLSQCHASDGQRQVPVEDAGPAHHCTRGSRGCAILTVRNPKNRKRCITKVDARGQRRRGIVGAVCGASGALVNHEVHVPPEAAVQLALLGSISRFGGVSSCYLQMDISTPKTRPARRGTPHALWRCWVVSTCRSRGLMGMTWPKLRTVSCLSYLIGPPWCGSAMLLWA